MKVYVESNFILELALEQEQSPSCESILALCEQGAIALILPAFSMAEPYETLIRRAKNRELLGRNIAAEIQQLSRSKPYQEKKEALRSVTSLLFASIQEEKLRLSTTIEHVLRVATTIPLNHSILASAMLYQQTLDLLPQDAIIYASVFDHLQSAPPETACFLNRNSRDFDNPNIVEMLARHHCKMLFNFEHGYQYIIRHKSGKVT